MMQQLSSPAALAGADPGTPPEGVAAIRVRAGDREAWAADVAEQLTRSAHVIAVGEDVQGALVLAAEHAEHVVSLVLIDPRVDLDDPRHAATMDRVGVPTLVIASAPTETTPIDEPQSIAGGVDNGVFVVIDGAAAPTLANRPESVLEWSSAFMEIAEGLAETRTDLIVSSDDF